MKKQIHLKTYNEILDELGKSSPNHLLLGNGFNNSLGIKTDYESIFEKMKEKYPNYSKVEDDLKECGYDIEFLIKQLKDKISDDNFLPLYIENKVKLDFMEAAFSLVKKQIKNVYADKNQGIHILFKNFTNYFTLNYDLFLYLLLMKFKKDNKDENNAIAFSQTLLFQSEDLNRAQNNIYNEIKRIRKEGSSLVTDGIEKIQKSLDQCTKTQFTQAVKDFFESKNWKDADIRKAVDLLWKEEKRLRVLDISDGFIFNEFKKLETQNLFFLHGAFHIYKDNNRVLKITQSQTKALYQKLEEILGNQEKDIVWVLTGTDREKKEYIGEDTYLSTCFDKLLTLSGTLVILGSSLGENDKHIFQEINKSSISAIYISSCEKDKLEDSEKAKDRFPNKKIVLFDCTTISYKNEETI